jgi:misacylated tRNA(Ala) deacylase
MTEELFRDDATLLACEATVLAVDEVGIVLDRTVFYPLGGGQAGDAGLLRLPDGSQRDARPARARRPADAHAPPTFEVDDAPFESPEQRPTFCGGL